MDDQPKKTGPISIPGLTDITPKEAEGKPTEEKERKGAGIGVLYWLSGAKSAILGTGSAKLIVGAAVLAIGAAGAVGIVLTRDKTSEAEFSGSPDFQGQRGGLDDSSSYMSEERSAAQSRRDARRNSSLGFVRGEEGESPQSSRAPAPRESVRAGSRRDYAEEVEDESSASPQADGSPGSPDGPKMGGRAGGGFGKHNIFSGRGGISIMPLKSLGGVKGAKGFKKPQGPPEPDMSGQFRDRAHAKLASKNVGSPVSASKAFGQAKFSGARSSTAKGSKLDGSMAAYSEQAFGQDRRERMDIDSMEGPDSQGGSAGGGPGVPGGAVGPGAGSGDGGYSLDLGQSVGGMGGSGSQGASDGCPMGMTAVSGGGCEPGNVNGADATTYDRLVTKAWSLIKKARNYTKQLRIDKSTKLAAEAEELGAQIREQYGQSMQGDIIEYWADRSNELTHWDKAKEEAREKRETEMEPKLDGDVRRAVKEQRDIGFK